MTATKDPKEEKDDMQSIVKKATNDAPAGMHKQIVGMVEGIFKNKIPPKQALGLTDEMVEGIYGQAYRLFSNGKYPDAAQLFRLLVLLDGQESRFTMGLAAALHMQKQYDTAAQIYTICAALDPENPLPYYHCSDCWMRLNDKPSALMCVGLALERCKEKPEYQVIKDRCKLSIENLKKEIIKEEGTGKGQ